MPTYEYDCISCHSRFEKRQGFNDLPVATCPSCGTEAKRRLSVPAIVFKGSGWYATDSRRSSVDSARENTEKARESAGTASPAADATPAPAVASTSGDA